MKKSYFLIVFFSIISFVGISQITVTDADLLDVGDIIYLADDESTIVNIGSPGQNQTWNFSALQSIDSWMMEVVDPTTTPFDQLYPNANLCIIDDGDFIYCNKSSTAVTMLGIGDSVYQQALSARSLATRLMQDGKVAAAIGGYREIQCWRGNRIKTRWTRVEAACTYCKKARFH